jgi:uncharacterized protein (DUF4415 family)
VRKPRNDDPENPPLTDAQLATAKRGIGHLPKPMQEALLNSHRSGRMRGKQVAPTKERITIRLNREAVAAFRKTGRGWQGRLNDEIVRAAEKLTKKGRRPAA